MCKQNAPAPFRSSTQKEVNKRENRYFTLATNLDGEQKIRERKHKRRGIKC
jgi:hypothetical protein